jgi:hypothetical protein
MGRPNHDLGYMKREFKVSKLCLKSMRNALATTLLQCHAVYS